MGIHHKASFTLAAAHTVKAPTFFSKLLNEATFQEMILVPGVVRGGWRMLAVYIWPAGHRGFVV